MKKIIKVVVKTIILTFVISILILVAILAYLTIFEDFPLLEHNPQSVIKAVSGLPIPKTAKVLKFDDYSSLNGNSYSYLVINLNDSQFKKILSIIKDDPMFKLLPLKGKDIRNAPSVSNNGYYMAKVIGKDNQYTEITNGYYNAAVDEKNTASFSITVLDIESQNIYFHLSIN